MRKSNRLTLIVVLLSTLQVIPILSRAQEDGLNTFSPYTFYGIGDFSTQGPTFLRSMGGIGVAYSNLRRANYVNPASFARINPKSALFNVGIEGGGVYAKSASGKTSYNSFNFRDIALQLPLWGQKIGMGVSVTPFSSVGYRVKMYETDPNILADVGSVRYDYLGDGNLTQFKFGVGALLFKNFTIGADLIYYHGKIERHFNTEISNVLGTPDLRSQTGVTYSDYSKLWMDFGFQYALISSDKRRLSIGATYTPRVNLKPTTTREIVASNVYIDTIDYSRSSENFYLPNSFTGGFYYETVKLGFGMDYTYQKWDGLNINDETNGIKFTNNHYIKVGAQYTPNFFDPRSFFKRVTYRIGYRYNSYYMQINGHPIRDHAITFGFGIPLHRRGLTNIDVGVELGQRGLTATGSIGSRQFQMVKERYFKISLGVSLFGEDYWFVKYKYE